MLEKPCLGLLREADELRHRDPQKAVRVAEGARDLAARVDQECVGEPQWSALQAEAWAILGSTYRAVADFRKAEGALNVALAFVKSPDPHHRLDPLTRPRLAQRASYLRCDQGRFEEALDLNDEALVAYRELAATQQLAQALVDRALILGRCGRTEEATRYLIRAFLLLDPVESPRSFLAAIHNMTLYLCESSKTEAETIEACRWLALAERQHARFPESVNLLKLRMLEGAMAIRRGDQEEGVGRLWIAHDGFEQLGSIHNQTIVLLHLAGVYLARGERVDVKKIAGRLFPILRKLAVDRETSAALMLFYKAAQAEAATLDLLDRAIQRMSETGGTVYLKSG